MKACSPDPGPAVALFHLRLALDRVQIRGMKAGGDVEIRPKPGLQLQPVFVLTVDIVNAAVTVDVERYRPVDLLVVFQRIHPVVFRQGSLTVLADGIVGSIADAQYIHSQIFQPVAELIEVEGKMGGIKITFIVFHS